MRLTIDHRTTYRFSEPQARLVQMLRLTPQNSHDQTIAEWRIDVDHDAKMRDGCDGWGNAVTMLYVEGPIDGIEIAVSGEVVTSHSDGVLHGVDERFPPPLFLRDTAATPRDAAIARWAAGIAGDLEPLAALHRINAGLAERFAIDPRRVGAVRDAPEAWAAERVTARELAQVFAVAARSLGAPARYLTGYSLATGDHRPSPHGWAEAHVPGIGWIGFDPCTGLSPQEHHVRVAVALDAAGAAPVAGSRLGDGDERLDVEVNVGVV